MDSVSGCLDKSSLSPLTFISSTAQAERNFLLDGMRIIEQSTCIRFVVRTTQVDFIDITNGSGCWSWLGRLGGRQELAMRRPGCFWGGIAEHEYMHALGWDHM
jgi:Astacin (Peptidase family M12A)